MASPETSSMSKVKALLQILTIAQVRALPSGCTGVPCDGLLSSRPAEA